MSSAGSIASRSFDRAVSPLFPATTSGDVASGAEVPTSGDEEPVPGGAAVESAEVERDDDVYPKLPVLLLIAPTASQLAEHRDGGHMPYRTWCGEWVETFGREEAHSAHDRAHGRKVAVVSLDYFSISSKVSSGKRRLTT